MISIQKIRDTILQASDTELSEPSNTTQSTADKTSAEKEADAFSSADDSTHEEMQRLRMNSMQVEMEKLQAEVVSIRTASEGNQIDNSLRKHMAWMTFGFMVFWCVFVAVVFAVYLRANNRNPPPEVIIALLGTSTITIVGLVGFVVSGLFKTPKNKEK